MTDPVTFRGDTSKLTESAFDCFAVTPHDTTDFANMVRGLYVGTTGTVVVVTPSGAAISFVGVPAGAVLPVKAKRVNSTDTTASNIVGLY